MWKTVLIVQLVAPLVLGVPLLIWGDSFLFRRKRTETLVSGSAVGAKRLKPLECPHCSAAVPLHAEPFPCPSCGQTVTPPSEYVEMLASRARAIAALESAERRWRWSRWTSSWPVAAWSRSDRSRGSCSSCGRWSSTAGGSGPTSSS